MATIHNLPVELLPFIFKHLGFVDLNRARRVCTLWKDCCDRQKLEELIIECPNTWVPADRWYHVDRKLNANNVMIMDPFDREFYLFTEKIVKHDLLSQLKRLMICRQTDDGYAFRLNSNKLFAYLNYFTKLDQLDLNIHCRDDNYVNFFISHPNIKIIALRFSVYGQDNFQIDAENLRVLKFAGNYNNIQIQYFHSLIKLEAKIFNHADVNSRLPSFCNLESIHTCTNLVDPIILTQLPNLKEFKFLTVQEADDSQSLIMNRQDFWNLQTSMISLMEMKESLKRKDFKIYFDNIELKTFESANRVLKEYLENREEDDDYEL